MVRFGSCSVDVAARLVERHGRTQHLEPQAFDVLAYLLTHADRVVPKEELLEGVWGDQFVSESALTTRVKEIRQALGDDGKRQAIIKNFRRRGYRFVAALEDGDEPGVGGPEERLITGLIGRDADIDEAAALLHRSRLVTLVGPGGVGKTSLADELARRSAHRFPDGISMVRLATVTDPASVIHVLRRDTGQVESGSDEDALLASLAALDALVVVDNCEHVLDEVCRLVADVIGRDGPVTFLATSRERLGVTGEQVWPVAPLDDGAAREMLLDRARRVQPKFSWSEADEPAVDRILHAIDRLPLAIEMAAARLPTIGVDELAAVLTSRLDLLRSADRGAVERHRTIDALIGWSESLLDDGESGLLASMSVFAGRVGISDIAAVAESDPAEMATGPLAGLVDKSLVVAEASASPACFRLLETVRARAARRRPSGVDVRHARHITAVVGSCDRLLRTVDEPAASERVDALVSEIRTAHAWARSEDPSLAAELTAAILWYAHERQWTEPAEWARTLESESLDEDAQRAVAAALAADASNRGDYAEARHLASRAATSHDPRVAGSALDSLINLGLYTGDVASARHHARTMHQLGIRTGDRAFQVIGVVGEVLALVYDGRLGDGQAVLDSQDTTTGLGPTSAAWVAYTRAEWLSASDRHDEAIAQFARAVRLGRSVGSRFVAGVAQVSSLASSTRNGDIMTAVAAFRPLLVEYRRTRSDSHGITAIRNLIEGLVRAERFEPAMELLGAMSGLKVKSTYGIESDRLDDARMVAVKEVGAESVERWIGRGAARDLSWALDHSIAVLDAIGRET